MTPTPKEGLATLCLLFTLIHSLNAPAVEKLSHRFQVGSLPHRAFHYLGEIEFIFGFWAILYLFGYMILQSYGETVQFLSSLHFHESLFVIIVMTAAATRPVLDAARVLMGWFESLLPFQGPNRQSRIPELFSTLFLAPLLGSFITEPAAMTVAALLIGTRVFHPRSSLKLKYEVLAVLFINVSIGGVLTSFAAPPVLMVARHWDWDSLFMFKNFGWKAILGTALNAAWVCYRNRAELNLPLPSPLSPQQPLKLWILALNLSLLISAILAVHSANALLILFALLLLILKITQKHQGESRLFSGLLVGFFLAGLTILTADQAWWLKPILEKTGSTLLFFGSTLLTAITDNAALTSLAASVVSLPHDSRYLVVAGAVTGGGLTLIANAPNPAGFTILKSHFSSEGLSAGKLFISALLPTLIAGAVLWIH
jgi:hypothetical protein